MVYEISETFTTVKELNNHYKAMRELILFRHNIRGGTKARLKNAMRLQQSFDGEVFLNAGTTLVDMKDRVKMYELVKDKNVKFRLVNLV